jgi:hypothetical protein
MLISFEIHLPKIISWKCLTKISLIIRLTKESFNNQSYFNCLTNMSHTLESIVRKKTERLQDAGRN